MEIQTVTLKILGRTFKFNCPVDEMEALDLATRDFDARLSLLREKSPQISTEQLIMTVALNISYELAKEKEKNNEVSIRLKNIQNILDSAVTLNN